MKLRHLLGASLFFTSFLHSPSYSLSTEEIEQLKKQCEKDKAATASVLILPSSCQQLQDPEPWEYTQESAPWQYKPESAKAKSESNSFTYEWHGGMQRYCYFNKRREVQSCSGPPKQPQKPQKPKKPPKDEKSEK